MLKQGMKGSGLKGSKLYKEKEGLYTRMVLSTRGGLRIVWDMAREEGYMIMVITMKVN